MGKLLDIFNPMFNVKEVCKELVLLEDHLIADGKHCPDCSENFSSRCLTLCQLDAVVYWKDGTSRSKLISKHTRRIQHLL